MIELHIFGDTLIKVREKEIRPTAPLLFAALLYLGLERGHRVPRTALQELLFPEADERSGAHSLRQLLYKLRRLGATIEVDAASVSLAPEEVRVDVADISLANAHADEASRLVLGFVPNYEPK